MYLTVVVQNLSIFMYWEYNLNDTSVSMCLLWRPEKLTKSVLLDEDAAMKSEGRTDEVLYRLSRVHLHQHGRCIRITMVSKLA